MEKTIQNKLREYIKKRRHLIWYVKDYDVLSKEAIVSAVLNYGNWDDFMDLLKILGIKETAAIFRKQISGFRTNYRPEIRNYFRLYFNKYVK